MPECSRAHALAFTTMRNPCVQITLARSRSEVSTFALSEKSPVPQTGQSVLDPITGQYWIVTGVELVPSILCSEVYWDA